METTINDFSRTEPDGRTDRYFLPARTTGGRPRKGAFMIPDNKVRINITLERGLYDNIGEIADMYGLPKSKLCAFWIGQGYAATHEAFKAIKDLPEDYLRYLSDKTENQNEKEP